MRLEIELRCILFPLIIHDHVSTCFYNLIGVHAQSQSTGLGKVTKNTVAFIILKWKTFRTTKTLLRAGRRRALVREVTKNPMVTLTEL